MEKTIAVKTFVALQETARGRAISKQRDWWKINEIRIRDFLTVEETELYNAALETLQKHGSNKTEARFTL